MQLLIQIQIVTRGEVHSRSSACNCFTNVLCWQFFVLQIHACVCVCVSVYVKTHELFKDVKPSVRIKQNYKGTAAKKMRKKTAGRVKCGLDYWGKMQEFSWTKFILNHDFGTGQQVTIYTYFRVDRSNDNNTQAYCL